MLARDRYLPDITEKHRPSFSMNEFVTIYSGINPTIGPYLPTGVSSIRENSTVSIFGTTILMTMGVAASLWYKKLPWFKKFNSTLGRTLWSAFFILVPAGVFSGVWNSLTSQDMQVQFMKYGPDFMRYLATRDITKLNSDVRLTND